MTVRRLAAPLPRRRSVWAGATTFAAALLSPLASSAVTPVDGAAVQPADRVVVVSDAHSPVTLRLLAELRFLGFEAEVVDVATTHDQLLALARDRDVAAAIAVEYDDDRVRVTVADRVTGKLVTREHILTSDQSRDIAVRAVELLRASLLEVETQPQPPEAEVALSDAGRRTLRAPPSRLVLASSVAVGGAPGGLPVLAAARIHLRYSPHRNFGVVLNGTAPLHGARLEEIEGTARIYAGWFGVGPWFGLRRRPARVVPNLSATVGPVFVGMSGDAAPGNISASTVLIDALFEAAAALDVSVSERVWVRAEVAAAACARTVRVRFVDRPVATWCRPHVLGSVGIGVALW